MLGLSDDVLDGCGWSQSLVIASSLPTCHNEMSSKSPLRVMSRRNALTDRVRMTSADDDSMPLTLCQTPSRFPSDPDVATRSKNRFLRLLPWVPSVHRFQRPLLHIIGGGLTCRRIGARGFSADCRLHHGSKKILVFRRFKYTDVRVTLHEQDRVKRVEDNLEKGVNPRDRPLE